MTALLLRILETFVTVDTLSRQEAAAWLLQREIRVVHRPVIVIVEE